MCIQKGKATADFHVYSPSPATNKIMGKMGIFIFITVTKASFTVSGSRVYNV